MLWRFTLTDIPNLSRVCGYPVRYSLGCVLAGPLTEINRLLTAHAWTQLARYYDFTASALAPGELTTGAYFAGGQPLGPEARKPRPFPAGWRFLYSETTANENVVRVTVAPPNVGEATQSFLMRRFLEGHRIIPDDVAERLPNGPSVP